MWLSTQASLLTPGIASVVEPGQQHRVTMKETGQSTDDLRNAHAGAIKVQTRKSDLFKVRQKDNEILREFLSRFQMEQMDLPPIADDWAVQAFTQGLNVQSSVASEVEDDQPGVPSGSVYPARHVDRVKRDIYREPRSNMDQYQPYKEDRRSNGFGRSSVRNERRNDQSKNNRGFMKKNGFDRPIGQKEASSLLEYNFYVDAAAIVSAIGCIKDTKEPRSLQSDPAQRDPNQMCKYHGTHGHRTEDCR
ncbi:PREDICTED: uncharacterized protein LOC109212044 [Nicotiana attenuata]|uniref:uncharacterized protein LOC109212044 n=1 Tax=Nicotiana attenuata TaxID=49451 RepID=UPI000904A869|nr:PREDICTED: uncharacterized protein LOC109212044 [Nicotiana attenuata]